MIPVIGFLIGMCIGIKSEYIFPYGMTAYVAIGILTCMDTMLGAIRSSFEKKFSIEVFLTGFFLNSFIAIFLVWFGKLLYIDLSIAAIVVFGTRIFGNFGQIRRFLLNAHEKRDIIDK